MDPLRVIQLNLLWGCCVLLLVEVGSGVLLRVVRGCALVRIVASCFVLHLKDLTFCLFPVTFQTKINTFRGTKLSFQ